MNRLNAITHLPRTQGQVRQTGYSLIELMVAMAVGLIISAGAATLFANTILSTRTLNSATQINELGTQLSGTLARQLRMAGYIDWLSNGLVHDVISTPEKHADAYNLLGNPSPTLFQTGFAAQHGLAAVDMPPAIKGCDVNYAAVSTTDLSKSDCASPTTPFTSSGLTVAYQVRSDPRATYSASLSNGAYQNSVGMAGDCNNQKPRLWPSQTAGAGFFAVNRYYLKLSAVSTAISGEPELYDLMCLGSGNTIAQPLASNIEQFVVTYGIATTGMSAGTNDGRVGSYQTAKEINDANLWGRVIAVRTCVLIAGERNTATDFGTSDKPDCNGTPIKFGKERRLRQAFTITVALRNQIHTGNEIN